MGIGIGGGGGGGGGALGACSPSLNCGPPTFFIFRGGLFDEIHARPVCSPPPSLSNQILFLCQCSVHVKLCYGWLRSRYPVEFLKDCQGRLVDATEETESLIF